MGSCFVCDQCGAPSILKVLRCPIHGWSYPRNIYPTYLSGWPRPQFGRLKLSCPQWATPLVSTSPLQCDSAIAFIKSRVSTPSLVPMLACDFLWLTEFGGSDTVISKPRLMGSYSLAFVLLKHCSLANKRGLASLRTTWRQRHSCPSWCPTHRNENIPDQPVPAS